MAEEHNSEHVVSLARFRMRDLTPTQGEEYSSTAERLLTLASAMPGFISFRHYTSDDGELLAVVEFASAEALAAWRASTGAALALPKMVERHQTRRSAAR